MTTTQIPNEIHFHVRDEKRKENEAIEKQRGKKTPKSATNCEVSVTNLIGLFFFSLEYIIQYRMPGFFYAAAAASISIHFKSEEKNC